MAGIEIDYSGIFDLNKKNWSIRVKRGGESIQNFLIKVKDIEFELELEFNREFKESELNYYPYPLKYRPDYTLKINNDSNYIFLHFDAKYKLNRETFKNEDIFKMHTYKDAIKNSMGAYVLYPGEKKGIYFEKGNKSYSVGAFPLKPGELNFKEENNIRSFLINQLTLILENDCF